VAVDVATALLTPTKDTTLETGIEYVKLLPETATALCWTKPLPLSPYWSFVSQGVTEVTVRPVRLKVWFTAEFVLLMATITTV